MTGRRARIGRLDRRLMGVVPIGDSPLLDSALPALGRAADHGVLWFAVAGAMGLARNRASRRAALRGLAALGVASATANLAGKTLVRRQRPVADAVPLIRRLRQPPVSSSFPSGHTASAVAFATGVALEHPRLAIPVAALAAGVGLSRVVTGVHYPSDVVAGAAIGVAAGLVTTRWWPTAGPLPALAPDASRQAPALKTGSGLVVVVNTAARGADETTARRIAAELPDAEVLVAGDGEEAHRLIEEAARRAVVLGVAGGDGTVNAAARAAAERGLPLLVVPAGTLNHFAAELGIGGVEDAVAALGAGQAVEVDLGLVNDRVFMNTFSIGAYVELVRAREEHERTLGKWPAMLLGMVTVLRRGEPLNVRIDGTDRRVWLLFAGNCRYEPAGLAPSFRPRLADGDLDVRIVDGGRPLARLRLLTALATGTLAACPVYEYRSVSRLSIAARHGELPYSVDGEICDRDGDGDGKLTLGKLTGRLIVYRLDGSG